MSVQLAFTVVGYAVGSYFGYPQLGTLVGALVGAEVAQSMLPDSTTSGPRLSDLKTQTSTYGADIPYLFGTNRVAGNVIWAADLIEVETDTTTSAGGKGSGPTQTTITYAYYGSFAVLLSFGPCRGIRRIWGDQVLIYDGGVDPPVGNVDYAFYQGTETQLPDPTMEAALGVGNVPGYRGYCYVVFNRLPLEKFGNRIPSITVELTADGEFFGAGTALGPNPFVPGGFAGIDWGHLIMGGAQRNDGQVVMLTYPNCTSASHAPGIELKVIDQVSGLALLTVDYPSIEGTNEVIDQNLMCYVPPSDEVWVSGTGAKVYRYNAQTFAPTGTITLFAGAAKLAYEPTTRRVYFRPDASWICAGGEFVVLGAGAFNIDVLRLRFPVPHPFFVTDCGSIGVDGTINYESMSAIITTVPLVFLTDGAAQSHRACFDPTRRRYVAIGSRIWTITDSLTPVITVHPYPASVSAGGLEWIAYDSATDSIIMMGEVVGIVTVTILDAETFAVLYQAGVTGDGNLGINFAFPQVAGSLLVLGSYQTWRLDYFATTVGAAVARLCTISGMDSGEFNVSELTQLLRGYLMAALSPARGAIEQLSTAYLFEGTEQDDILYFRRRGGATVATITADECGAGVDKADQFPISKDRAQEADLPARLFVAAPDPFTDYQPGSQYGERRAINAGDDQQVQLATVLTATEARRLADALIFDRWASRNSRKWTTARKYTRLVPTDTVLLDGERVRVMRRSDDGPVIHWEGVTDDADVVNQLVNGVQGEFPGQVVPIQVPSEMVLLDTALLRDADDTPGAYVGVYGQAPYYRGTLVFASDDGGSTWVRQATMPRPGTSVGTSTNALASFAGGFVFDEDSTINVAMHNGEPSSVTRAQVLAGSNGAAVQSGSTWEIIHYRTATLETDGTYTLSGLLRGQRGTGYAIDGHAAGDTVVLLEVPTVRTINIESGLIGVTRAYRPVSVGDSISETAEQDVAIAAERLKPWSPVDLRAARDIGSLDITFSWKRRTRLSTRFVGSGGINVPLGEATEAYEVEVYTDGTYTTLVRTITGLSSASAAYSAADQSSDGFTPGDPIPVRVFQLSAVVGRGHPLEAQA